MLIPVFTLFALQLDGATPTLIGIALGGYGLSQGMLQIPFGLLSDRYGRKPIITLGLLLFVIGSLVGALTHSIYGMIFARILQGMGAIGSVLIALMADLTPDEERTKAMAVIGMTIGTSFSLAMVLSPAITHHYGLPGIFYLTAFLACCGLILLHTLIPTPVKERFHWDSETNPSILKKVFFDRQLQRLNGGIFIQHFVLTATFFIVPMLLQQQLAQGNLSRQWHFYLPLMIISFVAMVPFILIAEKRKAMRPIFLLSVVVSGLSQLFLALFGNHWYCLCAFMLSYFIAFNILEASLPSLISKQANPHNKGTAMGIYSSSQFLGIFIGGLFAGILYEYGGKNVIFYTNAGICLIWLLVAWSMKTPATFSTLILNCNHYNQQSLERAAIELKKLDGVVDAIYEPAENVIYLRISRSHYQKDSAERLLTNIAAST